MKTCCIYYINKIKTTNMIIVYYTVCISTTEKIMWKKKTSFYVNYRPIWSAQWNSLQHESQVKRSDSEWWNKKHNSNLREKNKSTSRKKQMS